METLLNRLIHRIVRKLERDGLLIADPEQPWLDLESAQTNIPARPMTVARDGFSLNASVACEPYQRERLERLCRYVTRPPICLDRLTLKDDGQIQYALKNPFSDGATHILFSPLDFLGKLAALVPRPRHNLVRYHGIFAPNAAMRKLIVPKKQRKPRRKAENSHRPASRASHLPSETNSTPETFPFELHATSLTCAPIKSCQ